MAENRLARGLRATFTGMAVNAVLAASKLAGGVLGHSHALIADAVESMADLFSSLVVWRGLVMAAEPADEDHPYGHGKAEPIATAIVSTMLLAAAAWITYHAAYGLLHPHPPPAVFTLLVLALAMCVKEGLFRFVYRESISVGSSVMKADAWHHRSDAITSLAAFVGITVSLLGGPGCQGADDIAAIVAAGVIAWNGWRLLSPALSQLMDRSPRREVIEQIRHVAEAAQGVERVEKCRVRQMGHQFYVDMHVEVDPLMTVHRAHGIAHDVKDQVCRHVPRVRDVLVHIEPTQNRRLEKQP